VKRSPLYLWERARVRVVKESKFSQNSAVLDHTTFAQQPDKFVRGSIANVDLRFFLDPKRLRYEEVEVQKEALVWLAQRGFLHSE